jgi:hypothetical protein
MINGEHEGCTGKSGTGGECKNNYGQQVEGEFSENTRVSQKVKGFFKFSLGRMVTLLVLIPLV